MTQLQINITVYFVFEFSEKSPLKNQYVNRMEVTNSY